MAPSKTAVSVADGPLRRALTRFTEQVGQQGMILVLATLATVRGTCDLAELRRSLVRLGLHSIPVIMATAIFVGGIVVVQAAPLVERYGAYGMLGWGSGFSILREIGPILTGIMISGRVGSNNTAELGTLRVTEQIDGLRALAIDPAGYLLAPRVIAIITTTLVGTAVAMVVALFGAALTGWVLLGVHPATFYNGLTEGMLGLGDILHGLLKALAFGVAIAACSTSYGINAKGGAPGVGRAVNASVVVSAALIFAMDAFVSLATRSME